MQNTKTLNLAFEEIESYDSTIFHKLYEIYEQAFPLKDEREPKESFQVILDLNNNQEIQHIYGPYHEVVSAIMRNGEMIGGTIFGITTSAAHIAAGIPSSIQAIYTFISPKKRGKIPMLDIANYCRETALRLYGSNGTKRRPLVLFEVNNPIKMSADEIRQDIESSKISPHQRYRFWMKTLDALPLDFQYTQPRLREDADPVRYLDLFATQELPEGIPAPLLLNHLKSFVSLSVLKGGNANNDEDFRRMKEWLEKQEIVGYIDRNSQKIREILKLGRSYKRER